MSKKKLNTTAVFNELTGKSRFFQPVNQSVDKKPNSSKNDSSNQETKKPGKHDTTTPRYHDTTVSQETIKTDQTNKKEDDTVIPRHHDTNVVDEIRKALKIFGKEAATYRFTLQEKQELMELIYAFRQKNIRTSECEIARIAINWLMIDYKNEKDQSVLHQVLKVLNS